jgi:hypothetical protein
MRGEKVVDFRGDEYLVRWSGLGEADDTWVSRSDITKCLSSTRVKVYWNRCKQQAWKQQYKAARANVGEGDALGYDPDCRCGEKVPPTWAPRDPAQTLRCGKTMARKIFGYVRPYDTR